MRRRRAGGRYRAGLLRSALTLAVVLGTLAGPALRSAPPAGAAAAGTGPAALVDPFVGTGTGSVAPGAIDLFPGASLPFGMVQWSPDTWPDRSDGGGYDWADHSLSGFSLTHLSGPGCPYLGDVPILPVSGTLPSDPARAVAPFSHTSERATPGSYQVAVGRPATTVRLAVTERTGAGSFTFPPGRAGSLLFKASDAAGGSTASTLQVVGDDEVTGSVTGTLFCGTSGPYTLSFLARFNRPFTSHATWQGAAVQPGGTACTGTAKTACGGSVTFGPGVRTVTAQVAVSYVSPAGAAGNLAAERPGFDVAALARRATATWNRALGRISLGGPVTGTTRTFYTALYHSLLGPNLVSDADGSYPGLDGQVHQAGPGGHYTDISEWDIYRSQFPLVALLFPQTASAVAQSLVDDAQATGWLPRWPAVDSDSGQTDGDGADLLLAEAWAFGARNFDATAALQFMVHGATVPQNGFIQERQGLAQYLAQGWVTGSTEDNTSYGYTLGASATLEYALDDFGISRLAAALGQGQTAATFQQRAQNWQNLFNGATGWLAARQADGSFPPGPAFQPTHVQNQGQVGFEEGNAIQYSWGVPQNLAGLFGLMGGPAVATRRLDRFFTQLNASRYRPYYWAGNEPDLWAPWEYDFSGAPSRTQDVVRRILRTQYALTPAGEPGNDDLGAISSWYVWGALGLYPVTPGTAALVLGAPLFPSARIHLGNGRTLTLTTSGPAAGGHIGSASLATGAGTPRSWVRPWLPAGIVSTGGSLHLSFTGAARPAWGTARAAAPPSYPALAAPAVGLTQPGGEIDAPVGRATTVGLGAVRPGSTPVPVDWRVVADPGLAVTPTSGSLTAGVAGATGRAPPTLRLTVTPSSPGVRTVSIVLSAAGGRPLPQLVLRVRS
jgi:predicted alpha-1,2-mannosidase